MLIVGEASSCEELAGVFRQRQESAGLSNAALEHVAGLTVAHVDKLLGPARSRSLSSLSIDGLLFGLGLKLVVIEDNERICAARSQWAIAGSRDSRQIRSSRTRIARATLRHAFPHVVRELGRRGGLKTWSNISAPVRTKLMTDLIKRRWAKERSVLPPVAQETAGQ
jgi:hypothetical protein